MSRTHRSELRLVDPGPDLEASYRGLVREFVEAGEDLIPYTPAFPHDDFPTELLRLTLARAAELDLSRVLLICDKSNAASARVILRNGGVLDSEEFLADHEDVVQRYWIELTR